MSAAAEVTREHDRRASFGGAAGNERLTSLAGALLVVLLAVEGATIPFLRPLLSVHIFVGMLLLGPVALKLASTGYRFARYYTGASEYVAAGPPAPLMRVLVAPVLVLSTLTLFGTGVLLVASPHRGAVLGLHKASFVVWLLSTSVHVLARLVRMREALRARYPGLVLRFGVVAVTVAAGAAVAAVTLPGADHLQDRMSAQVGVDGG